MNDTLKTKTPIAEVMKLVLKVEIEMYRKGFAPFSLETEEAVHCVCVEYGWAPSEIDHALYMDAIHKAQQHKIRMQKTGN